MGKLQASCVSPLVILVLLLRLATLIAAWAPVTRTITVARQGPGDFRTVQSAVDSVPDGNSEWIRIHVAAGDYWEKVSIPRSKNYILLEGDGFWTTQIGFNDHAHPGVQEIMSRGDAGIAEMVNRSAEVSPTFRSATFSVFADNFVARHIAFKNTYNMEDRSKPDQAVAALVAGDKAAFYDCAFFGYQDTLCDFLGRHYFRDCVVMGAVVDFIFGFGQSIYDGCVIRSIVSPGVQQPGWVTAHARQQSWSPGGLVFKGGLLLGTGRLFLGRAWNRYATVVFYRVWMSDMVVPEGWQAWDAGNDVEDVTFAEHSCAGPGSNRSKRVAWEKTLSEEEVQRFVDIKYIDDDGWLSNGPQPTFLLRT
ncbi:hypothetical protein PR202_gb21877 [Eleusine coracana subsp. coracana]|uniref:pectinesterase n=1 Tax=Eleusine coracana subsp. coracana TaxID=191504 RepID=A0AAV5FFW1_ELECO|nr:hypothetical protein PR202_gb21877 [Eleusine coracana subsp. coracana]